MSRIDGAGGPPQRLIQRALGAGSDHPSMRCPFLEHAGHRRWCQHCGGGAGRVNWGHVSVGAGTEDEQVRPTDWFIPLSDPDRAVGHVCALPQAGGGATAFAALADELGPDITVWALNLPGRQARFGEPTRTDLDPLLDDLAGAFPHPAPMLLFGYCSGALLAFLLAHRLHHHGHRAPDALMVASYPAPDRAEPARSTHRLPGEQFWSEILSYGGVPERIAAQSDFREIFEPALRADYELLSGYHHRDVAPLPLPITTIAGAADPVLRTADVDRWRAHTTGPFRSETIDGDHWLLENSPRRVADLVRASLPRTTTAPR
ncbi:alpha/beta fold hydrolase [Actinoplanes sp. NPDC026619]|uniref:thioesterase II family protein n=1 Tax=Actinoplanes sp. NPDC026619 TaxID=3155798 RepID=UPI0033FA0A5D